MHYLVHGVRRSLWALQSIHVVTTEPSQAFWTSRCPIPTQPNLAPSIFSLAWQNANKNKGGLRKEVKARLITAVPVADIRLIGPPSLRHGWRLWAPFSRSALSELSLTARHFQIDISVFLPVRFSFSFAVLGEMISVATLTVCCR